MLHSYIISFWSSLTEPKRLSCSTCQATSWERKERGNTTAHSQPQTTYWKPHTTHTTYSFTTRTHIHINTHPPTCTHTSTTAYDLTTPTHPHTHSPPHTYWKPHTTHTTSFTTHTPTHTSHTYLHYSLWPLTTPTHPPTHTHTPPLQLYGQSRWFLHPKFSAPKQKKIATQEMNGTRYDEIRCLPLWQHWYPINRLSEQEINIT